MGKVRARAPHRSTCGTSNRDARGAGGRSGVIGESLPRGCGAGVIHAGDRRGVACAPGADPRLRGRGGRGVVRVGGLEPSGRHEGSTIGAFFEGQLDAPGSKEHHEEAEHECSIWVGFLDFVFCYVFGRFLDPA